MGRSLWKLWLLTTFAWSLFAVNLVTPAFQHGVFLAHLINPKYQDEMIKFSSNWGLNLLRNMHAVLHPSDVIGSLQVPFACDENDLQQNTPCWGTVREARRKLARSNSAGANDGKPGPPAADAMTDQLLVEQQYGVFDKWQLEVPAFTQFGILVLVITVCLRGPLVTLLAGLTAFALIRQRAQSRTQSPASSQPT